jgi:xanthine dehydrogenase YagR molybdenum-binding subunit
MAPYIGTPTSRVDGPAKVTGAAKYSGEFNVPGLAYGAVVTSTIAHGRIADIDVNDALRVEGVIDVLTHRHRPSLPDNDQAYHDDVAPEGSPFRPLYDDRIWFSGQPIALVLAEDSETATFAASLVRVSYHEEPHSTDLVARQDEARRIERPVKPRGDAATAFAAAAVRHEADYVLPVEHHNPMELFATTAVWEGDGKLTVYDKTQGVQNVQRYLRGVFGLKADDVRVVSPFVGGAFGSGLRPQYNVVLAVLGARALERSVRVVLRRQQMYGLGYRPATIERLALGATADGKLEALTHNAIAMTSRFEEFARNDVGWAEVVYKCDNTNYEHRLAGLDVPTPCDMRAPGAASGVYGLECAMDELAVALNIDPIELRLRNYTDRDQSENLPFTSKALRECYRRGADAFGWANRNPQPRSMRDGHELVGWGMAGGVWEALQMKTGARIVLSANGHAEVFCAASDIGTGTHTILAQIAADMLGLPIESVSVKLADSTLPAAPVEGGSWTAASAGHAVATTAMAVRAELLQLAKAMPDSPLADTMPGDVILTRGTIASRSDPGRAVPIADIMRHARVERIEQQKTNTFDDDPDHARNTHSAVFAEVKIDEQLGVIRVTRLVSAVAAGRILNPKTAGSQIIGGLVWGLGMALQEETHIDPAFGRVMNPNIAEYHVPVHADVYDIQVIFVEEQDDLINPMGIKGVGEIGIVGVAAAIANAVYHATGKRVRSLPITLDKLM